MGRFTTWSLLFGLLLSASCATEDEDKYSCPPNGIGVEEFQGMSIQEQVADYKKFSCTKPQICPDQGGQAAVQPIDPSVAAAEATFLLTNCSTGGQKLEIESIELWGDGRCFFDPVTDADIQEKTIIPGVASAVRTVYRPTKVGEDHAELRITSNAQNYPLLKLRVCGLAVDEVVEPPPEDDAGVSDAGASDATPKKEADDDAGARPALECKAATKRQSCD